MGPVGDHRFAVATFALGDFVFVVGEHQILAAAVNIEPFSQKMPSHGGAFDVPARPSGSPWAVPRGFAGFAFFPEGEIQRIAFVLAGFDARAGHHIVNIPAR